MKTPMEIEKEFVVLSPEKRATTEIVRPTLYEELDQKYNGFKGHELISAYSFDSDWPGWEMHPAGDEIVILLSGRVTFVLDIAEGHQSVSLETAGSYVIVPRGVWHTAKTDRPTRMIFITPGEGTRHRNAAD